MPAGLQVLQAKVTLTDTTGDLTSASWDIFQGGTQGGTGSLLGSLSAPSPGFADFPATPYGPGSYHVSDESLSGTPGGGFADYTFIFDVHPIPEPGSIATLTVISLSTLRRLPRHHRATKRVAESFLEQRLPTLIFATEVGIVASAADTSATAIDTASN